MVSFATWRRRRRPPRLALIGVTAAVAIGAALTGAFIAGGDDPQVEDPCTAVIGAQPDAPDPLASAGLSGATVSSRLVREFAAVNVNCAATVTPSASRVQGVFVELVDASGTTAAVYVALHPRESRDVWHHSMRETFQTPLDFYELGDGSMLAVVRGHPGSAAARAAYEDAHQTTPLWRVVGPLLRG